MRLIQATYIFLFVFVLSFPLTQHYLFPQVKAALGGVTAPKEPPKVAFENILNSKLQNFFDYWFIRKLGIRAALVKTDNQINLEFFRQLSISYRSKIVLGNERVLIEREYLKSSSKMRVAKQERLLERARALAELQRGLERRGMKFLLIISPNKPSLYPEHVPRRFQLKAGGQKLSALELFLPLLDKFGVHYIDGHEFLAQKKPLSPYLFFAPTGTHWNDYASCMMSQRLIDEIEKLLEKPLLHFTCDPVSLRKVPLDFDRDLLNSANIWSPQKLSQPVPQPQNTLLRAGGEYRPRVLFVGSSFLWAILRYFDRHGIYEKRNMFYYFKRNFPYPRGKITSIDRENLNWEKQVWSHDIVIFEVNEAFVHRAGYGFLKYALPVLRQESKE